MHALPYIIVWGNSHSALSELFNRNCGRILFKWHKLVRTQAGDDTFMLIICIKVLVLG